MFKGLILKGIRFYQSWPKLSPCRFQPTCSEYAYQAIAKYGILQGSWLGFKRIVRCHPWSQGGFDPI